jgi:FkbM family methyltransferase
MAAVHANLVYDIGLHDGSDTAFYLGLGHRVVAVDARPESIRRAEEAFEEAIRDGRLLVHRAVTAPDAPPTVPFFVSAQSEWSSLTRGVAGRDETPTTEIHVATTTVLDLLEKFGCPYYLKIDIEGADEIALEGLSSTDTRPTHVSVEAESATDAGAAEDEALRKLEILAALGYRRVQTRRSRQPAGALRERSRARPSKRHRRTAPTTILETGQRKSAHHLVPRKARALPVRGEWPVRRRPRRGVARREPGR